MTRTLSILIALLAAGLPAKGERPEQNGDPSPAATLPEFSWDRVPLYMHIQPGADATATISDTLTPGSPVKRFARLEVVRN